MSGRNFTGKICVHHREGGSKKNYYLIDFFRRLNMFGHVYKVIRNSTRTAYLSGVIYQNGLFSYIILSENLNLGDSLYSGYLHDINQVGSTSLLKNIKLFAILNNIELYPNSGSSLVRSAGVGTIITSYNSDTAFLKLKSG
jgi:ribosomal protein L2